MQEMKIILATPIVPHLPQQVLDLLQCMEDNRERYVRGRLGWMTGGRARMSSETAAARSYLDNGERDARLLAFNFIECSF